jgi:hypothetical protein
MTIIESKELLIDEKFTFDISELTLVLEERSDIINNYKGVRYLFSDQSDFEFKLFVKFLLEQLISGDKFIYLFFSDRFVEKKDRIRSYQKLFYEEKNKFGRNNSKELEVGLNDDTSIITGIVKLEEDNLNYLTERLFSSDFTFLFESAVDKKEILCEDFLLSIKEKGLMISDMRYLNPLKTLLEHKRHIDSIMYLQGFGNNDQSVEILTKKIELEKFLNIAKEYQKKNLLISLN